jgi:hypothetical protein
LTEEFERLVTAISAGARGKVGGVATVVMLSGAGVAALGWRAAPSPFGRLVALKIGRLVPILLFFGHATSSPTRKARNATDATVD